MSSKAVAKKNEIVEKLTNDCFTALKGEAFYTTLGWWIFSQEKRRWYTKTIITNVLYNVIKKSGILDEEAEKPKALKINIEELDIKTLLRLKEKNKQNTSNTEELVVNNLDNIANVLKIKLKDDRFEKRLDTRPVVGFRDSYNVFDFESKTIRISEAKDLVFTNCNATHFCDSCHAEGRKKLDYEFRRIIVRKTLNRILNFVGLSLNPQNKNMFMIIVNPPCILWKLIQESLGELCAFSEKFNTNGKKRLILHTVGDEEKLISTINSTKKYESNVLIKYTDTSIDYNSKELNETLEEISLSLKDCVVECHPITEEEETDPLSHLKPSTDYKIPGNISYYIDAFLGLCLKAI